MHTGNTNPMPGKVSAGVSPDTTDSADSPTASPQAVAMNFTHGAMTASPTCAESAKPGIWGEGFTKSG